MKDKSTLLTDALLAVVPFLSVLGCGYTIVKSDPAPTDSYKEMLREQTSASERKRQMLCTTWRGSITTEMNGTLRSVDTLIGFSINRDGTWSLRNRNGIYQGHWTFRDDRPSFNFNIHCDCSEQDFNKYFVGYFRDWGVQLYSIGERPHYIEVQWKLHK